MMTKSPCRICGRSEWRLVTGLCLACYHAEYRRKHPGFQTTNARRRRACDQRQDGNLLEALQKNRSVLAITIQSMAPDEIIRRWDDIVASGHRLRR